MRRALLVAVAVLSLCGLVLAGQQLRGPAGPPAGAGAGQPDRSTIDGLTSYLTQVPGDWVSWSTLGQLQLEQGRATADPALYARAEASFARSLRVHPQDNFPAIAGQAALAAARHDFHAAAGLARHALAINPLDAAALGTLTDALTELGPYPKALAMAHRLDRHHPGVPSFSRLAYQAELRGQVAGALSLLRRAAQAAGTDHQLAFVRYQEGILALSAGRVAEAEAAYRSGIAGAPDDTSLAHLAARLAYNRGGVARSFDLYRELISRRPAAAYAVEFADLLRAHGRTGEAQDMIAVAQAQIAVVRANGVAVDPAEVMLEVRYGDPARAVRLGRELWSRQQGIYAAEALGVALHAVGKDREALRYADLSLAMGTRTLSLRQHRDEILRSLSGGSR
jgi:tetratricopeptide (TPR) repeat protein